MILRLNSVAGFAEPALPLMGRTPENPQNLPRGATHWNPFGVITSGRREIERVHPRLGDSALSYNPISMLDLLFVLFRQGLTYIRGYVFRNYIQDAYFPAIKAFVA